MSDQESHRLDRTKETLNGNTFISMPFPEQQKKQTKAKRISTVNIADTKSINIMPHVLFSCDMMCIQHLNYVHWLEKEDDMELEKLDIILNPHSCLEIHCHFLLNGLHHVLTYPSWFHMALNYTMHQCGLSLLRQADNIYHYEMKKAFMTPPLSYLMDQQVPYGSLDRIDLVFDWTTNKPKEFQTVWKRERLSSDLFVRYMQDALYQLVIRKTCYQYPLIFSNHYVKKLSSIMSYLPHIAHSFQKIYTTSKSTMSVNNHDFAHTLGDKLKTIKMNTDVMNPYNEEEEEKITTHLVLGMYHTIKTAHKMRTCPTQKVVIDPPNAMCTVAKLWSTTACTSSLAHTQRP